eukprot:480851-Pleurochrysis_carterae.AAC.1
MTAGLAIVTVTICALVNMMTVLIAMVPVATCAMVTVLNAMNAIVTKIVVDFAGHLAAATVT